MTSIPNAAIGPDSGPALKFDHMPSSSESVTNSDSSSFKFFPTFHSPFRTRTAAGRKHAKVVIYQILTTFFGVFILLPCLWYLVRASFQNYFNQDGSFNTANRSRREKLRELQKKQKEELAEKKRKEEEEKDIINKGYGSMMGGQYKKRVQVEKTQQCDMNQQSTENDYGSSQTATVDKKIKGILKKTSDDLDSDSKTQNKQIQTVKPDSDSDKSNINCDQDSGSDDDSDTHSVVDDDIYLIDVPNLENSKNLTLREKAILNGQDVNSIDINKAIEEKVKSQNLLKSKNQNNPYKPYYQRCVEESYQLDKKREGVDRSMPRDDHIDIIMECDTDVTADNENKPIDSEQTQSESQSSSSTLRYRGPDKSINPPDASDAGSHTGGQTQSYRNRNLNQNYEDYGPWNCLHECKSLKEQINAIWGYPKNQYLREAKEEILKKCRKIQVRHNQ